jgi:hypothetical protein
VGAIACFVMMFQMQPAYAFLSIIAMMLIYLGLRRSRQGERDLAMVIRGVLFQMTRQLQVLIQKRQATTDMTNWRPSVIAISRHSATRLAPFDALRWISHYYGFGSYIHFIEGPLNLANNQESKKILAKLVDQTQASAAGIYVDTIVSPTFKTAVAQIVQIPGIAGMENNSILFEFNKDDEQDLGEIIEASFFAAVTGFNICVLRSGERHFGYRRSLDIWLTPGDYRNANLMILLSYIILGHPDWENCEIRLFDTYEGKEGEPQSDRLDALIAEGRLPISLSNVQKVAHAPNTNLDDLVARFSEQADLVVLGLSLKKMRKDGGKYLKAFKGHQDMLFVRAGQDILINESEEIDEASDREENEDNQNSETPALGTAAVMKPTSIEPTVKSTT